MSRPPPSPERPTDTAAHPWGYTVLFATAAATLALDQASKWWIVSQSGFGVNQYPPRSGIVIIEGFFNIVHVTNTGAAWGMLSGHGAILAGIAIATLLALYWFRRHFELERTTPQVAFGLLLAGITGNLIDRMSRGHVIDFLDFLLPGYRWPTFNIADSAIFCGALLYFLHSLQASRHPHADGGPFDKTKTTPHESPAPASPENTGTPPATDISHNPANPPGASEPPPQSPAAAPADQMPGAPDPDKNAAT